MKEGNRGVHPRKGLFSHTDPEGGGPAERVLAAGYGSCRADRPWTAAEALGVGIADYADGVDGIRERTFVFYAGRR